MRGAQIRGRDLFHASDQGHDFVCQFLEVFAGAQNCTCVATEGTVGCGEFKDGLTVFLRHGDEAAVMLDGGEAIRVVSGDIGFWRAFVQNSHAIN